ncbi:uncharacterized protein V1516DRAFT_665597 [Lipomyces oligophaga]|uniref:uncharacterized protein n=1 Tax=Lipomyces oligophaga TaxID=45792 RepID=UPI0034CDB218
MDLKAIISPTSQEGSVPQLKSTRSGSTDLTSSPYTAAHATSPRSLAVPEPTQELRRTAGQSSSAQFVTPLKLDPDYADYVAATSTRPHSAGSSVSTESSRSDTSEHAEGADQEGDAMLVDATSESNGSRPSGSSRRVAHILSEQRRRESINGGFLVLKSSIPHCRGSQDSKAVILRKAVQYITSLEGEVERLHAQAARNSHHPSQHIHRPSIHQPPHVPNQHQPPPMSGPPPPPPGSHFVHSAGTVPHTNGGPPASAQAPPSDHANWMAIPQHPMVVQQHQHLQPQQLSPSQHPALSPHGQTSPAITLRDSRPPLTQSLSSPGTSRSPVQHPGHPSSESVGQKQLGMLTVGGNNPNNTTTATAMVTNSNNSVAPVANMAMYHAGIGGLAAGATPATAMIAPSRPGIPLPVTLPMHGTGPTSSAGLSGGSGNNGTGGGNLMAPPEASHLSGPLQHPHPSLIGLRHASYPNGVHQPTMMASGITSSPNSLSSGTANIPGFVYGTSPQIMGVGAGPMGGQTAYISPYTVGVRPRLSTEWEIPGAV